MKRVIAGAFFETGLLTRMVRHRLRDRAVILMYHRVLPSGSDTCSAAGITVSQEAFDRQLSALRKWLKPLSWSDLARCLDSGAPLPPGSVLITFDDGWQDNWRHALPILRKHDIPALIFLATDYIDTKNTFWQERLMRLLRSAISSSETREIAQSVASDLGIAPCLADDQVGVREYVTRLKQLPTERVIELEGSLASALRAYLPLLGSYGDDQFLTWDQACDLVRSGHVTLGSHGCSHTPFTRLSEEQLTEEMERSRRTISHFTGKAVDTVAYPNGDFDGSVAAAARHNGYRAAFTTEFGYVKPGVDPFQLPRINICDGIASTRAGFLCRLLGWF